MKITTLFLSIVLLATTCSCQTNVESRIERWADDIEKWAEDFEDSMENYADSMEDFADSMEELAENASSDSTLVIYNQGGVVTYYKWQNKGDNSRIRISKNDRYLTRKFDIEVFKGIDVNYGFQVVMCDTVDKVVVRINEKLDKHLNVRLNKGILIVKLDRINGITFDDNAKCGYIYLPYNTKLCSISLSGTSTFYTELPIRVPSFNIDLSGATACTIKKGVVCNALDIEQSGRSQCHGIFAARSASVDMSGATHFAGAIKATNTELDLSGTSSLQAKINTSTLETDLSGASSISLSGKATTMEISLSGTSRLDCGSLETNTVSGDMSGASNANIGTSQTIAVDLTGRSALTYSGSADISRSTTSSLATINGKRK